MVPSFPLHLCRLPSLLLRPFAAALEEKKSEKRKTEKRESEWARKEGKNGRGREVGGGGLLAADYEEKARRKERKRK